MTVYSVSHSPNAVSPSPFVSTKIAASTDASIASWAVEQNPAAYGVIDETVRVVPIGVKVSSSAKLERRSASDNSDSPNAVSKSLYNVSSAV